MKVVILDSFTEAKYEDFLSKVPNSLFYHSNKYRTFLKTLLKSKDVYFLAIDKDDQILGALPAFLFVGAMGSVLNSLPFYGSNGGLIGRKENLKNVSSILVNAFIQFSKINNCISSTIISSPFEDASHFYEELKFDFRDERISQITYLNEEDTTKESLMKKFSSNGQNIRKAIKNSVNVIEKNDDEGLQFIMDTHYENMEVIGGLSKSNEFFDLIPDFFTSGVDYKVYLAEMNGTYIAGVLLFYYQDKVEYFTPVVKAEYRTFQPLSLLIFKAMQDAAKDNFRIWNWGGTWLSQEGVYKFKQKWDTVDTPYYYYIFLNDSKILSSSKDEILSAFPNFYVIPFNTLKKK